MGNYYSKLSGMNAWQHLLADHERQWKPGCSAYDLAYVWEQTTHLPHEVEDALQRSDIPTLRDINVLFGFPEYKVSLPGKGNSSCNDLYLLANVGDELLPIMVEGKTFESFGEKVEKWLGKKPSNGKKERLAYLLDLLELEEKEVQKTRYQLLHRTASAVIEAKRVKANHALVLIHSLHINGRGYEDYSKFVEKFHLTTQRDRIVGPVTRSGIQVYFGWVTTDIEKSKKYFFNMFQTEEERRLAREIDEYLYKKSPYKDEVEDYHMTYKQGRRTDCIGYVSKKGTSKFLTITQKRKKCLVLHLGKKLHTHTAEAMQKEIDALLGHEYKSTDKGSLTPGEVYIRLEWVGELETIRNYIDQAYKLRLETI